MSGPSSPSAVLEREFPEIRCRLLDLAAALDRVSRAGAAADDRRWQQVQQAIASLAGASAERAECVQMAFSLPYDEHWRPAMGV